MRNFLSFFVLAIWSVACAHANTAAIVIGGVGGGSSLEIITESSVCLGTSATPTLPNAPSGNLIGWTAEYVDGKIHLCGGQDSTVHRECQALDIGNSGWGFVYNMNYDRRYASSLTMPDGRMVILGGYNKVQGWLDTVEMKPTGINQLQEQPSWKLPRKIFDFCAVALNNTHILVAGGNMPEQAQLDNVDILDTVTGTWHSAAPLPSPRSSPGCILTEIGGELGVMLTGGLNSEVLDQYIDTQFYSPSSRSWRQLENMTEKRMGHKMYHVGDSRTVSIVGGYNDQLLNRIETYIEGSGWRSTGALTFARYQYGGVEVPSDLVSC